MKQKQFTVESIYIPHSCVQHESNKMLQHFCNGISDLLNDGWQIINSGLLECKGKAGIQYWAYLVKTE